GTVQLRPPPFGRLRRRSVYGRDPELAATETCAAIVPSHLTRTRGADVRGPRVVLAGCPIGPASTPRSCVRRWSPVSIRRRRTKLPDAPSLVRNDFDVE